MRALKKSAPVKNIDEYLVGVPPKARAALQRLRTIIRAAAPKATETISYQIPTYKYHGMLVSFAAFKEHCSFFPGAAIVKDYKRELLPYSTSKGTVRFPPEKPLPAALVKKIVKARMKENEARQELRKSPKAL